MSGEEYECGECGDSFASQPALNSHRGQIHNPRVEKACEWCGELFEVPPSEAEYRVACCEEHGHKVQGQKMTAQQNPQYSERVEIECRVCGTVFEVTPSQEDDRQTCSMECLAKEQEERFAGSGNPNFDSSFDLEAAIEDYERGLTSRDIARKQGVSDPTVLKRLREAGVEIEKAPAARKDVPTVRGEMVRSSLEKIVADWLYENGFSYEYEPDVPGRYVPDFKVGEMYVEVWGWTGETYEQRRREKEAWYDREGLNLIGVEKSDVQELAAKFGRE